MPKDTRDTYVETHGHDFSQEIRRRQTDINKLGMIAPEKMPSPLREVPGKTRSAQKVVQTKSLPVGGAAVVSRYSCRIIPSFSNLCFMRCPLAG